MSDHTVITVLGRTGDGKSALCNSIARRLGMPEDPFNESDATISHTHAPAQCQVEAMLVTDTPGLMDTSGVEKDETNIRLIVENARSGRYINAFILVINEQAPRFDAGMQDAVKLIVDSFGPGCLAHMGFVFTKAFGGVTPEAAQAKAAEFAAIISSRTHVPVHHIPAWQVDCHPEKLAAFGVPEAQISERIGLAETALDEMLRWARSMPRLNTDISVVGEYEHRRAARKAADDTSKSDENGFASTEMEFHFDYCDGLQSWGEDIYLDKEKIALQEARAKLAKQGLPNCFVKLVKCEELSEHTDDRCRIFHECFAVVKVSLPPASSVSAVKPKKRKSKLPDGDDIDYATEVAARLQQMFGTTGENTAAASSVEPPAEPPSAPPAERPAEFEATQDGSFIPVPISTL